MSFKRQPIIAFDGPAGAGKSTVARQVAVELGYRYLDTGAMYRALALEALRAGVDLRDEQEVLALLNTMVIDVNGDPSTETRVFVHGEEVTDLLRTPEVNASVSLVAEFLSVRNEMVDRQRQIAREGGVVIDGRDAGTVVVPGAEFKFFLTASLTARALRRQRDLARIGYQMDLAALVEDISRRDHLDSTRVHAPLRKAADAVLIDTSNQDVEAVVAEVMAHCREHVR